MCTVLNRVDQNAGLDKCSCLKSGFIVGFNVDVHGLLSLISLSFCLLLTMVENHLLLRKDTEVALIFLGGS